MDEDQFPQEDIENLVKNAISACLSEFQYQAKLVNNKIHAIVDACLKELQTLNRPFKYIVTCIIMQKNGAGLDTGAALFWDNAKDGLVCIPWDVGVADGRGVGRNFVGGSVLVVGGYDGAAEGA